jgi:LPS sulfotransferase NodH
MRLVICATPRVGATALLSCLRHLGAAEWPDGDPITMVHATQLPVQADGRCVYVWRRDRTAQAISWAIASAAGRFHSTQQKKIADPDFDRGAVDEAVAAIDRQDAEWRAWLAGRDVLELCYEDDIEPDPQQAASRALEWAGLPGEAEPPKLRRVDVRPKARWRREWENG